MGSITRAFRRRIPGLGVRLAGKSYGPANGKYPKPQNRKERRENQRAARQQKKELRKLRGGGKV